VSQISSQKWIGWNQRLMPLSDANVGTPSRALVVRQARCVGGSGNQRLMPLSEANVVCPLSGTCRSTGSCVGGSGNWWKWEPAACSQITSTCFPIYYPSYISSPVTHTHHQILALLMSASISCISQMDYQLPNLPVPDLPPSKA